MSNEKQKTHSPIKPAEKTSFGTRLRRYLLTGIVVTAPISITIYLTYIFLTFIDSHVTKLFPDLWYNGLYGGTTIPGLGLIVAIAFFIFVGWFATNFLGRLIIRISEYIVDRVPVIRTLYGAVKQIFETIMASQSSAFREAVMLEYPRKGVWSIGFVTGRTEGEVQHNTKEETINVFVPTTPNPTSGYLLFVPKKELVYLDMTVEEAVKLVVSAGIITPPEKKADKKPAKKASSKKAAPKAKAKATKAAKKK
jgi:uncharacterized membrane protein